MSGFLMISLIDAGKRGTSMRIEVKRADANATYVNAAAMLGKLQACTKLGTIKADMLVPIANAAADAVAGSNTDVGGKVRGVSHTDGKTVLARVPDPIADILNPDYTFDLTQADLAAFLAEFEDPAGTCMLSDGEQVDSWLYGVLDKH